jgi:uncharacterized SAM-binding protein YcdF (DUF218 family)
MSKLKKFRSSLLKIVNVSLIAFGLFFILVSVLAFTSWPYYARYRLATKYAPDYNRAKTLVVMGGGGFPSESVLMRLWFASEIAIQYPELKIVITTPGNINDESSTLMKMRNNLLNRGIDSCRIILEPEGLNSRHQALQVRKLFEMNLFEEPLVIVTSAEHVHRSVMCFQKAGFENVGGQPTLEAMLETDLKLSSRSLGGNKNIPGVGQSISLRYSYWNYLKYEVDVAREYIALAYYKIRGWI